MVDTVIYDKNVDYLDWVVGMVFENIDQFRLAVRKYAIAQDKLVRFKRNESRRVKVVYKGKFPWLLYASPNCQNEL